MSGVTAPQHNHIVQRRATLIDRPHHTTLAHPASHTHTHTRAHSCRYAAEHGVQVTTFDCVSELQKIAAGYPAFKCVLRIRCDDASAKINLGLKYGADMADVPLLLGMARDLGLQVGV